MNSITGVPTIGRYYDKISFNPIIIIVLIIIILLYFFLFKSLGGSSLSGDSSLLDLTPNTNGSSNNQFKFLGIILVSVFVVLILINGFTYFLNINIITSIKNFFSKTPEINIAANHDITTNNEDDTLDNEDLLGNSKNRLQKQVYHIPNNTYTYDNAKAICTAFGDRLASYKEIENAYNNGADWCSYGWSENQMAFFPTQYDNWSELQKTPTHKHDCGRPGINGGYIDNPNVKFGVNCYGYKPKIKAQEAKIMKNASNFHTTKNEAEFENKVDYWKNNIDNILISPFNKKSWSRV